jgi:hypothetical protein
VLCICIAALCEWAPVGFGCNCGKGAMRIADKFECVPVHMQGVVVTAYWGLTAG